MLGLVDSLRSVAPSTNRPAFETVHAHTRATVAALADELDSTQPDRAQIGAYLDALRSRSPVVLESTADKDAQGLLGQLGTLMETQSGSVDTTEDEQTRTTFQTLQDWLAYLHSSWATKPSNYRDLGVHA